MHRRIGKDDTAKISCSILGEQRQLVIAEREIKLLLEKVNVELNQLLVEELQLKSNDIAIMSETNKRPKMYPKAEPNTSSFDFDSAKDVNQQNLNLSANESFCFEIESARNVNDAIEEEEDEDE